MNPGLSSAKRTGLQLCRNYEGSMPERFEEFVLILFVAAGLLAMRLVWQFSPLSLSFELRLDTGLIRARSGPRNLCSWLSGHMQCRYIHMHFRR